MNFSSTKRYTSKLYPDVSIILKRPSVGLRCEFEGLLTEYRAKQREIRMQAADLDRQAEPFRKEAREASCTCEHGPNDHDFLTRACLHKADDGSYDCRCRWVNLPADLQADTNELVEQMRSLEYQLHDPALLKFLTLSLEGVTIDDQPADIAAQIEKGDELLTLELIGQAKTLMGLQPEEIKNSLRPTTSPEKEAQAGTNGTAQPASAGETIGNVTASGTSQS